MVMSSLRSIFFTSLRSSGIAKVWAVPAARCASGAAHAVDKVLRFLGQIVVDDVRHVRHIDAARRNVGRHQHAVRAVGKALQRGNTLRLGAVAVDARRVVAHAAQPIGQPVRAMLGAGEDQEAALMLAQQVLQQLGLLVLRYLKHLQRDVVGRLQLGRDVDAHRVLQILARHLAHLRVERGGVAQRLPVRAQLADDALDGGLESHVQHAIALIEHQHFHAIQLHQLAIEKVFEPARGCDHQAHAAAQRIELRAFGKSADDQRGAHVALRHQLPVDLLHLHGQLARGQQHQRGDLLRLAPSAAAR